MEILELKSLLVYKDKLDKETTEASDRELKRISKDFKFVNPEGQAKERYDEAYDFAEIECCAGMVCIDLNTVEEALKIAAGIK